MVAVDYCKLMNVYPSLLNPDAWNFTACSIQQTVKFQALQELLRYASAPIRFHANAALVRRKDISFSCSSGQSHR